MASTLASANPDAQNTEQAAWMSRVRCSSMRASRGGAWRPRGNDDGLADTG